jgi:hypothetical protein
VGLWLLMSVLSSRLSVGVDEFFVSDGGCLRVDIGVGLGRAARLKRTR